MPRIHQDVEAPSSSPGAVITPPGEAQRSAGVPTGGNVGSGPSHPKRPRLVSPGTEPTSETPPRQESTRAWLGGAGTGGHTGDARARQRVSSTRGAAASHQPSSSSPGADDRHPFADDRGFGRGTGAVGAGAASSSRDDRSGTWSTTSVARTTSGALLTGRAGGPASRRPVVRHRRLARRRVGLGPGIRPTRATRGTMSGPTRPRPRILFSATRQPRHAGGCGTRSYAEPRLRGRAAPDWSSVLVALTSILRARRLAPTRTVARGLGTIGTSSLSMARVRGRGRARAKARRGAARASLRTRHLPIGSRFSRRYVGALPAFALGRAAGCLPWCRCYSAFFSGTGDIRWGLRSGLAASILVPRWSMARPSVRSV
jgi:hypothetical protein